MPIPVYKYKINTNVSAAVSDNTTVSSKPIVEPAVAPDALVKSNIRKNIDRANKPGGNNSVTRGNSVIDTGTRMLEGVKTFGGSMIGDAIQGVSPKSAIGNNGMFNMSNPNIYKAIVPAITAGIALKNKNNTIDK